MADEKENEPRLPRWKSWTRGWLWVFLAIMLGLLVASIINGNLAVIYLSVPGILAIGIGAIEMFAPRKFLVWRDADTSGSSWAARSVEGFDDAFGVSRNQHGEFTDSSVRHVRYIGAGVFVFGVWQSSG
ncbi:MAG: hypothetical protein WD378_03340 [Egicoccus sp.]